MTNECKKRKDRIFVLRPVPVSVRNGDNVGTMRTLNSVVKELDAIQITGTLLYF